MAFINPKTDFAFKKIFGSVDSKDILISFLNALLYEGQPTVEDLEIIDPYAPSKVIGLKDTYLDVKAKLAGNQIVIIEMQVLNVESCDKRILYNAAKVYATQLEVGEGYSKLNPVIALTITDFEILKNRDNIISHFVFKEKQELFDYPSNDLEMVFVELPKFHQKADELKTLTEKWIYFMKNTSRLKAVPETMGVIPEIQKAFRIASQANLSRVELEDLEKREMFIEDQRGAIIKGKKEGLIELLLRLLRRRLGTVAPEVETRIDKLSSDQLEDLGEAMLDFTAISDLVDWLQAHRV